MLFETKQPIEFVEQSTFKGKKKGVWNDSGIFVYFGADVDEYHIKLKKARKWLGIFERIGGLVFGLGFLAIFFVLVYQQEWQDIVFQEFFWTSFDTPIKALFWVSMFSFLFLIYKLIVDRVPRPEIEHAIKPTKTKKAAAKTRISSKRMLDVHSVMTKNAEIVIDRAYMVALKFKSNEVLPVHLFAALLTTPSIMGIFIRLGVSTDILQKKVLQSLKNSKTNSKPELGNVFNQIIFGAYIEANTSGDRHVRTTHLLMQVVANSEMLQELLYDLEIDQQKLHNVLEWVRIRERLLEERTRNRAAAARYSKYGMDKAMTAVATPFLNSISKDLTIQAKFGHLAPCVARDSQIDEIFRIVTGGHGSVLLVGEQGVGKMSIIHGIAQKMVAGEVPARLNDKRLVQISTSSLLAGTTVSGAQQRLIQVMNEVAKAGNIILVIDGVHDLVGMTGGGEGLDVSETLAEYASSGQFLTIATTNNEGYNRYIVNSAVGSAFSKVEIAEMDENQAIQVLESKVGVLEHRHNVFFSYDAIEACVELGDKFFHDHNLPESALSLLNEVASFVGADPDVKLVTAEHVGSIVGQKTGIPTTSITEDESEKLMRLEEEMHNRVIGQDEAVVSVANALRRARAEIRSQKRPIANFLFVGPTGVGKTELAKTISDIYFGGEDRMIRFDMSEYQDRSSIYRLIGQPAQQGTGLLTEAVRENPFSLVLFDELEKADPNVLNLFLQVFDDGRLTDSVGRVVDFTNTIIIATSNAGTSYVQKRLAEGADMGSIKEELMRGKLKEHYRPEFLNRFDGIVLFKALERDEIKVIAKLMLKRVERDLEQRGVALEVTDEALEALAERGFDPEFGARPMRRAIQDMVENKLAELILAKKLKRRDIVVLGAGGEVSVKSK